MSNLNRQFSTARPGLVPVSPGGNTRFLRADGTWAIPGGSYATGLPGLMVLVYYSFPNSFEAVTNGTPQVLPGNYGGPVINEAGVFTFATGQYTIPFTGNWKLTARCWFDVKAGGYRGLGFSTPAGLRGARRQWTDGLSLIETYQSVTSMLIAPFNAGDLVAPAADCGDFTGTLWFAGTVEAMFTAEYLG